MKKSDRTLAKVGEFGWLQTLLPRLFWPSSLRSQLCIGPGDDAGILRITPDKALVATTDAMVEGVHFDRRWFGWDDLGHKILSVNLSDLAAMGAVKPLAALVSAAFPGDTPVETVDKFYKGMQNCAQLWKTGFLGGDTVGSPRGWFISITVLGEANPTHIIRRSGAQVGDILATTGPLGLAAAGLQILQNKQQRLTWTKPLVHAFSRPQPRFKEGAILGTHQWATSLMDCSDGLEASVRLLAQSSRLGAVVELSDALATPALRRWAALRNTHFWFYILQGGEDYELIFTVRPSLWEKVQRMMPRAQRIGYMTPAREGCWALTPQGQRVPLKGYGFKHFS